VCACLTTEIKSSKAFNRKYQPTQDFLAQDWAGSALQLIQALSGMGFPSRGKGCPARAAPSKLFGSGRREAMQLWGTRFQDQKRV